MGVPGIGKPCAVFGTHLVRSSSSPYTPTVWPSLPAPASARTKWPPRSVWGGMGEVYQATDTKLKRQVAIKVLPESVAADPERLARFQREAETLASLNHPNIAIIHALVMELVEGDDLSQRIARGAIPVDEALPIAKPRPMTTEPSGKH